jgi:cell division protein ZipA
LLGTPDRSQSTHERGEDGRREPTMTIPEMPVRDRLVAPPLVDLDTAIDDSAAGRSIPLVDSAPTPADGAQSVESAAPVAATPPKLDLPAESERIIVALRVVARGGERFSGASLRQALLGEGFVHGEMEIFHRVMADGRTLLSAASLTKPGSFDLGTMDSTRFLGINLFAVLPGPLPGRDAVDKLLLAGHTLAQRLKGELLDSQGQPLTEARLAEMRLEAARGGS